MEESHNLNLTDAIEADLHPKRRENRTTLTDGGTGTIATTRKAIRPTMSAVITTDLSGELEMTVWTNLFGEESKGTSPLTATTDLTRRNDAPKTRVERGPNPKRNHPRPNPSVSRPHRNRSDQRKSPTLAGTAAPHHRARHPSRGERLPRPRRRKPPHQLTKNRKRAVTHLLGKVPRKPGSRHLKPDIREPTAIHAAPKRKSARSPTHHTKVRAHLVLVIRQHVAAPRDTRT